MDSAEPNYGDMRTELDRFVGELVDLSAEIAGTPSQGGRQYWSSVLLAKMTLACITFNKLVPRVGSGDSKDLWDLGSIATLARGIAEGYLLMHWLCIETEDEALWELRIALLRIVDNRARYRMIDEVEGEAEPVKFITAQKSHAEHLATMDLWHQMAPNRQQALLKGNKLPFIQDDVVATLDLDRRSFRSLYRYLSAFVHTGTISFFRAESQGRGHGEYNAYEANAMLLCISFTNMILETLLREMRAIHFKQGLAG